MTALIVDMDDVAAMLSARDQIEARVERLKIATRETPGLHSHVVMRRSELPQGLTVEFADALWNLASGTAAMFVIAAVPRASEGEEWFMFDDIAEVLSFPNDEAFLESLYRLERIEERIGARLLALDTSDGGWCDYYTVAPKVRSRLGSLMRDAGMSRS